MLYIFGWGNGGNHCHYVIATAKRARQLVDHAEPTIGIKVEKPVSIAVDEIYAGKIKVRQGVDANDAENLLFVEDMAFAKEEI